MMSHDTMRSALGVTAPGYTSHYTRPQLMQPVVYMPTLHNISMAWDHVLNPCLISFTHHAPVPTAVYNQHGLNVLVSFNV